MRILVASSISSNAMAELARDHELIEPADSSEASLLRHIGSCDGLIFRSGPFISAAVLHEAAKLRFIIRAGSGYDNIDLDALASKDCQVFRIPSPGAKAVAELAFTMMLALSRQLSWADTQWRAGNWVKGEAKGRLLSGQSLGIVGAGNIGARTGALGAAWGMNVRGCVGDLNDGNAEVLRRDGISPVLFDEVLEESDFISVHVPLLPTTVRLIGSEEFARMRPGAIFVNLSRGGVVDESALRDALTSGHLGGAGLDVHEREGHGNISPLADLSNVILTPHIGANTAETQDEIGQLIVKCVATAEQAPPPPTATEDNFVIL
jgi:D-3-phosphoglycerate dehydrogenase